nr:hypothetical protein BaRGS_012177 [Batillaria attramentaria]
MKYVSSSEDLVVAVNMANEVLVRNGITESRPTGTSWSKLNKTLTMVESFGGVLWGLDQDHDIWHTVYEAGQDVCNL